MADHYGQAKASDVQPNGLLPGDVSSVTQVLDAERWSIAERRTAKLIAQIQPNKPSEERRKAVASYVERLITKTFPCQVFTFGSVPLKTYLPDGDIDLSAFSDNLQLKDTWANELRQVLENEEKNENAEFHVKEVQYIQAEVKIIKCLIENIVVDVSFNQLGGLCTLCFLEAIDHLIDQDHLFKRSIILIKAWCYYESRILGAHHGLISTYALETLVLYIFHVFNNSFSGPLEVLYRFLEFFSNFDWENFCVSLWGPVPISSLPDTTAEPPWKNSGELLLSKLFYNVCNTISPAFSNSQESQSQPFVSKHFNVIDPLRTNNNLGRSVSKGNFYRIRSALAFGAKRLAGLLECSTNILVDEIDNFFINTWRRHGSGHRPDLPSPVLRQLQPLSADTTEDSENIKNHVNREMRSEAFDLHAGHGYPNDGSMAFGGISSQPVKATNKSTQNMPRTSSPSSCSNIHDSYGYQTSYGISDQIERRIDHNEFMPADKFQKMSNPDIFQRTHSSPELTGPSAKIFRRVRQSMELDEKKQITSEKPTQSNGRKNLGSEFPGGHSRVSIDSSFRHGLSERGLGFHPSDSNIVLDGYHHDAQFASLNELASASASDAMPMQHKMRQDEQDLINMMVSSSLNSSNGWVQRPTNISSHPRVPFPPVLVPNGYSQRSIGGLIPSSTTLIHPPGSITQFPEALASSHYFRNAGLESNQEATLESVNDSSSMTEVEQEDSDHGFWPEQNAGSGRGFLPDKRNIQFQITNSDDKQLPSLGRFKSIPSHSSDSNGPVRGQNKFLRGDRRSVRDDYSDAPVCPNNKEKDLRSTDKSAYSRLLPACPDSSFRSESVSDFSDFSSKKVTKSGIDRRRRKQASSAALASSSYNKEKSGWQYEDSSSDNVSVHIDEDNRECVTPASRIAEMAEPSTFSSSLATAPVQGCQVSGTNPALINGSDSVIPVSPVLLCTGSQQRVGDDSGGAPIAFFPAGPLVSIVMVPFPFYKTPPDSDDSGGSRDQLEVQDTSHVTPSGQSYDVGHEDPDSFITSSSVELSSSNHGEGRNPDILNSDLVGHWQNLQFGRFCHTPSQGPLVGPSPVMVPQMHLQGHFPLDGSRRLPAKNFNAVTQNMSSGHRFIPFMPPQPGSSGPSGLNQNYREEVRRFRGGTGTYLPDPKVSFRDRQTPGTRHRRGNFHHDWNEHDDREGNWSSSKSRYRGRSHVRTQADRPYTRVNQSSTFENKADRLWDSHRHGRIAYYQADDSSFGSIRSKHGSASVAHGMRALPAVQSKCINRSGPAVPPAVELYPSVPIAGDASIEQVGNNVPWSSDGGRTVGMFKQSHDKYQEGSSHTSQD